MLEEYTVLGFKCLIDFRADKECLKADIVVATIDKGPQVFSSTIAHNCREVTSDEQISSLHKGNAIAALEHCFVKGLIKEKDGDPSVLVYLFPTDRSCIEFPRLDRVYSPEVYGDDDIDYPGYYRG